MKVRNTFIIFIVSGFWHGANWTFIIWGLLNAIYFLPLLLTNNNRNNLAVVAKDKYLPTPKEFFLILITFSMTVLSWVFFRAENVEHALQYILDIFKDPQSFYTMAIYYNYRTIILLILFFIILEWFGRENQYAIEKIGLKWKWYFRWFFYSFIVFLIGMFMQTAETPFIYFQF